MIYFVLFILLSFTEMANAEKVITIALEKAPISIYDKKSIERGAKLFASHCMMCHTMIYMRYNPLAQKAGVTYDKMPVHVTTWPNNAKPPDLSLEASRRGVDWLYTYLHSFYIESRLPTGANNLLVPNTAMPYILAPLQGQQILVPREQIGKKMVDQKYQWYDLVELKTSGSMTPEQFDATMADVVNFLQYAAEPYQEEQRKIGMWVIGYLIILLIWMVYLKKSYWKNIKKQ